MSDDAITIRPAEERDLERIFSIYNHEVLEEYSTFDTEPRDPVVDAGWLSERERRYPVLVGELDGELAGWGAISQWSPRGAYARTAEVSVYVDRAFRRRGVGRALLAGLVERAPAGDIAVLLARVVDENAASVRLHTELGFEPIGLQRRAGEKHGRILDVTLLDLHLDED